MIRPWPVSYPLRDPERLAPFLRTLGRIEGRAFDHACQQEFQAMLVQDGLFRPSSGLAAGDAGRLDSPARMPLPEAARMLEGSGHADPPKVARTTLAQLKKMCLCTGSASRPVALTAFGRAMAGGGDPGGPLLNYLLKWQIPSPVDPGWRASYICVKPFPAVLELIREVDRIWGRAGRRPAGITRGEFAVFVPTLERRAGARVHAEEIAECRRCGSDEERRERVRAFLEGFYRRPMHDYDLDSSLATLGRYGDNTISYFRATGYVRLGGGGRRVGLEPLRGIEIDRMLASDVAEPLDIRGEDEYVRYVDDPARPDIPWDGPEHLRRINARLAGEIPRLSSRLARMGAAARDVPPAPPAPPPGGGLRAAGDGLRRHIALLRGAIARRRMEDAGAILSCVGRLEGMRRTRAGTAAGIERLAALALMALGDALEIRPGCPAGDDGEPRCGAPDGEADVVCRYAGFSLACDATMRTGAFQWQYGGKAALRHLADLEASGGGAGGGGVPSYGMFVAPSIHAGAAGELWKAARGGRGAKPRRIMPITIATLCAMLRAAAAHRMRSGRAVPHQAVRRLYDGILSLAAESGGPGDWIEKRIPEATGLWGGLIAQGGGGAGARPRLRGHVPRPAKPAPEGLRP